MNPVSDFFVPRSDESYAYVLGVQDPCTLLVRPRLRWLLRCVTLLYFSGTPV